MVDQRDVGQESTLVVKMAEVVDRETCTKLVVEVKWEGAVGHKVLFVKGTWNPTTFSLALSDGLQAWIFEGSEEYVSGRMDTWDKDMKWVMDNIKLHLSHQQPNSKYTFMSSGSGNEKKLLFGIEDKENGVVLNASMTLRSTTDPQTVTLGLLEFLLQANCDLSEQLVRKTRNFERMQKEAKASQEQSERFKNEKVQSEEYLIRRCVAVLNSKKGMLRKLRDQLAERGLVTHSPDRRQGEDESEGETESESDTGDDNDHEVIGANQGSLIPEPPSRSAISPSRTDQEDGLKKVHEDKPEASRAVLVDQDATQPYQDIDMHSNDASVGPTNVDAGSADAAATAAAALLRGGTYKSTPRKRRRG